MGAFGIALIGAEPTELDRRCLRQLNNAMQTTARKTCFRHHDWPVRAIKLIQVSHAAHHGEKADRQRLIDPLTNCPDQYTGEHLAGLESFPRLRLFWPRLLVSPETIRGRNSLPKRISGQRRGEN
jgi:hypothetical protein